jgi:hypothetical protein
MTDIDTVTTSNGVRLSGREWLGVGLFTLLILACAPSAWKRVEPFDPGPDYRLPFALGNDYAMYDRFAHAAAGRGATLLVGDSVVWGHFTPKEQTLSHHLNVLAGSERFANLGLDGSHPAALAGLLEHFGSALRGMKIVLQCNPTWISSPEPDLQDAKLREATEFPFNHAQLLPQFFTSIPCYRANLSTRLGYLRERNVPFFSWTRHLQCAYFDNKNVPGWILDHPYENPLARLSRGLPPSNGLPEEERISWTARGLKKQDLPWVELKTSIQWASFRRAVEILRRRDNKLLVVVGPYNEHALTESSLAKYRVVKQGIEEWLRANDVPYIAPAPLPSESYADSSHPLDAGYALLAQRLFEHAFFGKVEDATH